MDDDAEMVADAEYARVEAIDAGFDVLHQITQGGAIAIIIDEAREKAIAALNRLVRADPDNPKEIRDLQWQVTRYDDLCRWIAQIIETARQAREDITDEEAAALAKLLRGEDQQEDA